MGNHVWIESPVEREAAELLDVFARQQRSKDMHVTLAFSKLKAEQLGWGDLLAMRDSIVQATETIPAPAGILINGYAVLGPNDKSHGVVLVNGGDLWEYHNAVESLWEKSHLLDNTYSGWLPHITVVEGLVSTDSLATLRDAVKGLPPYVPLERPLLRAGRLALPL